MARIRQLPNSVVTKIAAGEVIERPASVVKELVENSVDAGATRIDVEVEQGGADLIRVIDNGHGILPEDFELAFSNHATSKLESADDLFCVGTMGFRGEALASIAGVAQVKLQSRAAGQEVGAEMQCHGGELSELKAWNGALGTRIEVRHLFFNTPVRRKFLRAPATEMGHLSEVMTRLALSRPGMHLSLTNNGKRVVEVPGELPLLDRIQLFFGNEVREKLYAVDARHGESRLYGFVGDPSCDRGAAKLQYLFLNSRWIRDRSIGHAIQEGYRGLLMTGRYPVSFLYLDTPPDQIDVNVHPTKCEVRFRDSHSLYGFVLGTVKRRLADENLMPRLQTSNSVGRIDAGLPAEPSYGDLRSPVGFPAFVKVAPSRPAVSAPLAPVPALPPAHASPPPAPFSPSPSPTPFEPPSLSPASAAAPPSPSVHSLAELKSTASPAPPIDTGLSNSNGNAAPALGLQPEGVIRAMQLHNQYLVLETPEGMLVIDQHALHERILFDQIRDRVATGRLESQMLLIPEPVDLSSDQSARVLEMKDALATLGLGVEDFGGNTVLVTRYPALMGRRSPGEILRGVVDHVMQQDRPPTREQLLHDLMSLMACHSAVRSGDPLSPEQIETLVAMRSLASDPHHCPHGRPTALLFSRHDLDRQFRRI